MKKIDFLFKTSLVSGMAALMAFSTPVNAISNSDAQKDMVLAQDEIVETESSEFIEGMVSTKSNNGISTYLLANGEHTQHPSAGGTWKYGFWNVKVRSYYTVNKKHGSSVKFNGSVSRSVDTASGKKSVAEKYAINIPGNDDAYYYRIVK